MESLLALLLASVYDSFLERLSGFNPRLQLQHVHVYCV